MPPEPRRDISQYINLVVDIIHDIMPTALLTQLRDARKAKLWSQRDLSERAGIPQAHISRIESGAIDPKVSTLQDLARVLDLDLVLVPRTTLTAVDALVRENAGQEDSQRLREVVAEMYSAAEKLQAMAGGLSDRVADVADELSKLELAEIPPWIRSDILTSTYGISKAIRAANTRALDDALTHLRPLLTDAVVRGSRNRARPAYTLDDEA
ncbi:conserved hypothetical protein [Phenylobacterium zucineum HLK1]|uniref:HTH cro/C1-type domain-containing protein n=2 Tax=Phenylobacterium zucineum TaxID=284016 RepID=B4RFY2_PHEZH|nr:conserved hypothetical protein [Phenylobacterium zucineum HLK1]